MSAERKIRATGSTQRVRQAVVWLLAAAAVFASRAPAQDRPTEVQVKAVYMFNFGKFIEWPATTSYEGNAFSICVLGEDPFGATLDSTLAGETLKGKRAVARRIARPQDAIGCQILFIGASEEKQLRQVLTAVEKMNLLTVSDIRDFAQRGGMMQFILDERRVRFEVNVAAARSAGLTLSSELLRVAKTLRGNPSPGI